jgi:hypothetical protein
MQQMTAHVHEQRDGGLALGLLIGTVVGAGLAIWLAPRLSQLRQQRADFQNPRDDLAEADADAIARAADDGAREPVASPTS